MFIRRHWGRPAKRKPRACKSGLSLRIDVLEDRVVLSAAPCPPPVHVAPAPPSPVTISGHTVNIQLSATGNTSVFVQQTGGTVQVFYASASVNAEYDYTGVCTITVNGSAGTVSSNESVFFDTSLHGITLAVKTGAGNNFAENDSNCDILFQGTKGIDSFINTGSGVALFNLGSNDSSVTSGSGVSQITCSGSSTSSANLNLSGCNLVFLGTGDTTIFANDDSSGLVVGGYRGFKKLVFAESDNANCWFGLMVGY